MKDDGVQSAPLISVALCTYNGAAHLAEQLDSLLAQAWPHLEIVAIDDASSDDTWRLLQEAAARDRRLRVFRNDTNIGFSLNFQRAMSMCRGEWIAPCDQDDIWRPDKLPALMAAAGNATLAYCDSMLIDESGNDLGLRVSQRLRMVQGSEPLNFAYWNCVSGHAALFRRELLQHALPLPEVRFHDWWLAFVAASHGSIAYLDKPLVSYRQHGGSQTDLSRRRSRGRQDNGKFAERLRWLAALSRHPSPHQPVFERLYALGRARQHQWFCPRWCAFVVAHASAIMAINRREPMWRFVLKQFFGMRWRALLGTAGPPTTDP